jgi:hypothetical protein
MSNRALLNKAGQMPPTIAGICMIEVNPKMLPSRTFDSAWMGCAGKNYGTTSAALYIQSTLLGML